MFLIINVHSLGFIKVTVPVFHTNEGVYTCRYTVAFSHFEAPTYLLFQ